MYFRNYLILILCDGCKKTETALFPVTAAQLRDKLKRSGWSHSGSLDLCSRCDSAAEKMAKKAGIQYRAACEAQMRASSAVEGGKR
jgi:hypothetical protein